MDLNKTLIAAAIALLPATSFAQDWTGTYAGVALGGSDIDVDGGSGIDGDGTSVGIYAGYNIDAGGIVYGVEIDYDSTEYEVADGAVEVDSTARLKGRVGVPVGTGLAYGTAGVVSVRSDDIGDDIGYLYGIGYDMPVGNSITVGAELLGHEFEDYDDRGLDIGVTTFKVRVGYSF